MRAKGTSKATARNEVVSLSYSLETDAIAKQFYLNYEFYTYCHIYLYACNYKCRYKYKYGMVVVIIFDGLHGFVEVGPFRYLSGVNVGAIGTRVNWQ